MENKTRVLLEKIFTYLEKGEDKLFWDNFSNSVTWIVEGTHPLSGKYNSLSEFRAATFDRLKEVLVGPIKFRVKEILADGAKGAVILEGESESKDGMPFHNRYCWVVHLAPDDKIDRVDAFLDTQLIAELFARSESQR